MPTRTCVSWKFTARLLVALLLCSTFMAAAAKQKPLTNDDIVKMTKAGLDEDVIIGTMQSNANAFDVSPDGLITLKKAGVNAKVLHAMQALSRSGNDAEPASVSTSAPVARDVSKRDVNKKDLIKKTPAKRKTRTPTAPVMPAMSLSPTGKAP